MAKAIGLRTALYCSSASTSAGWTQIAYVRSIQGPSAQADEVEATCLDTTGNYREFIQSLIDPGEVTFDLAWDPAQDSHVRLTSYMSDRQKLEWKMVLPTTTKTVLFDGWVRGFGPSIPVDDLITSSVTVRLTSGITWPTS